MTAQLTSDPAAWAFADSLLALSELGRDDVVDELLDRWRDVDQAPATVALGRTLEVRPR